MHSWTLLAAFVIGCSMMSYVKGRTCFCKPFILVTGMLQSIVYVK